MEDRELTYGEKAVGLTFNPSNDPLVQGVKEQFAAIIDGLHNQREATDNGEKKRQLSLAITAAQESQMWAVKAITWVY